MFKGIFEDIERTFGGDLFDDLVQPREKCNAEEMKNMIREYAIERLKASGIPGSGRADVIVTKPAVVIGEEGFQAEFYVVIAFIDGGRVRMESARVISK